MKASTIAVSLALILALIASFWCGGEYARRRCLMSADTVYVERWVRDSVRQTSNAIIAKIPVFLPLFFTDKDTSFVHDTTSVHDSVLVEVPITEKTYVGDNYKATVRGFRPELTDIWVRQRETTITVPYRKRWSFTVGPQAGIGYTPQGWQPYAGVGITFGYSF